MTCWSAVRPGRLHIRQIGPANDDGVADFNVVGDVFRLSGAAFAGLGPGSIFAAVFVIGKHALDDSDQIIYDKASGDLLFDADGVGGAAALRFATVTPGTALTADDFIVV